MEGKNPCDVCGGLKDCEGCVLDVHYTKKGLCNVTECFCNDELGCLLSLDSICKASSEYIDENDDENE